MISYTPTNGEEINLFPVQSIKWASPSNVKQAGKIDGVPVFYVQSKNSTISMKITWVNKEINNVPITEYIRTHSRYGVLKIGNYTYNVYASFTINQRPVVEGDLYEVSVVFTVVDDG